MSISFVLFYFAHASSANGTSRLLRLEETPGRRAEDPSFLTSLTELLQASASDSGPGGKLKAASRQAAVSEVTFTSDCELGYGYDVWQQKCLSPALIMPRKCKKKDDQDVHCIAKDTQGQSGWTFYNMKTQQSDGYSSLMSAAMSGEGTGWGVTASASMSYMQSHAVTSNSVGFWIGATGDAYNTFFQNPTLFELNDAAKIILATDWRLFIESYGTHYVKKVINSATFIGSAMITSTSESSTSELSTATEISYLDFFSVGASFDSATSSSSSSLDVRVDAFYFGDLIEYDSDSDKNEAQKLAEDYSTWTKAVNDNDEENSVPTRLVYRPYYDVAEIQSIIVQNYDVEEWSEIFEAFQPDEPTSETLKVLTEESVWTEAEHNTLTLYKSYDCVQEKPELLADVIEYRNRLTTHLTAIQTLDDNDVMRLQEQIEAGNYTWFIGRDLTLSREIEERLSECPVPDMCHCVTSGGSYNHNQISCTESGPRRCADDEVCYGEETVFFEEIDEKLCTKDWCACDVGNLGHIHGLIPDGAPAGIYCAHHDYRYCAAIYNEECIFTGFWKFGQWDHICFQKEPTSKPVSSPNVTPIRG